jgi:hypothetical protein
LSNTAGRDLNMAEAIKPTRARTSSIAASSRSPRWSRVEDSDVDAGSRGHAGPDGATGPDDSAPGSNDVVANAAPRTDERLASGVAARASDEAGVSGPMTTASGRSIVVVAEFGTETDERRSLDGALGVVGRRPDAGVP